MKKLLTLLAVGSIAFGVVSAAAASLGTTGTVKNLGAATVSVSSCGSQTGFNVSYSTTYGSNKYTVTNVLLTATGGDWTGGTTCVGQPVRVAVNGAEDNAFSSASLSDGTGTWGVAKAVAGVMTLDITDTDASTFTGVGIMVGN